MLDINHKVLSFRSFSLFWSVIRQIYPVVFVFSLFQILYQTVAYYVLMNYVMYSFFVFNAVLKPALMLLLLGAVKAVITKEKVSLDNIWKFSKGRCWQIFLLYFIVAFCFLVFGRSVVSLAMIIVFLRFPFVEAMIYFNKANILSAIKDNYRVIPRKALRFLMMLLFLVLLFRYAVYITLGELKYSQQALYMLLGELVEAVYTAVYHVYMVILFFVLNKKYSHLF